MIGIRPSRADDGARAVEIWRAAVDATHHFLSPEDRRAIDVQVQAFLPNMPLWLAVDKRETVVAFMGLADGAMEALFVHPDCHGMGVGRRLVEHAIRLKPTLTTTVNEQNLAARGFYEHLGFVPVGRQDLDDEGRPYPIVRLRFAGPRPEGA